MNDATSWDASEQTKAAKSVTAFALPRLDAMYPVYAIIIVACRLL
jgi:hypothetical protein